jgi:transposase InsO family protein
VENRFSTKIKSLYSDNGGEYIGLKNYLSVHGISHYTTAPHTPQQNGMFERRHRHLVETGLTLLTDAHMPLYYWSYVFQIAAYLINRMPTTTLHN